MCVRVRVLELREWIEIPAYLFGGIIWSIDAAVVVVVVWMVHSFFASTTSASVEKTDARAIRIILFRDKHRN